MWFRLTEKGQELSQKVGIATANAPINFKLLLVLTKDGLED